MNSSASSNSDDENNDPLKLMENNNPIEKLKIYGKIKRMMMTYVG